MNKLTELSASRELIVNLTLRELRGKYKRSVLGWLWSLINPLATMVIFSAVFGLILKVQPPVGRPSGMHNFPFFLMCGLLPWNFVAISLSAGIGSLVANGNLIKKVYFPREVVVASTVFAGVVAFLIELGVLSAALLLGRNMVLPWLPIVVLLVFLLTIFVLGIGLALAAMNVYFSDVAHLFGVLLQVWFYATPIVYPVDLVPYQAHVFGVTLPIRRIYGANPMVKFVRVFRDCLYDLRLPAMRDIAYLTVVSFAMLLIGQFVFTRLEPRIAEEL